MNKLSVCIDRIYAAKNKKEVGRHIVEYVMGIIGNEKKCRQCGAVWKNKGIFYGEYIYCISCNSQNMSPNTESLHVLGYNLHVRQTKRAISKDFKQLDI